MRPFDKWIDAINFLVTVSGDVNILLEVLGGIGIYCHRYQPDKPIIRGQFMGVYRKGPARPFAPWEE
jgi:hypothetical protein